MHRGTSLLWGHVEPDGLRCCYHGWKFDVEGNCIEQPCEPNPFLCRPEHRQPWYPVRERYGLVWAYMGPPEKMPVMPRFDSMEPLEEGEDYLAFDNSLGSHGDINGPEVVPYSWLHMNDNVMDPFHVQVLHTTFSGTQFVREFAVMPTVEFEEIEAGVIYKARRDLEDGRHVNRVSTWIVPNVMCVPDVAMRPGRANGLGFSVPVDDASSRILMCMRAAMSPDGRRPMRGLEAENFKPWHQRTLEERQDQPSDYEAQAGQGAISLHSEEHLVTSDKGIAMQRRALRRAMDTVAAGGDPPGVAFDNADATIHLPSGNYFS
jgi:phenylpropionate dioxygenase-like ring-hydroxylating dioxygenase large terminal subunit